MWLSWLECHSITKMLQVQFPGRAHTYLVVGWVPDLGVYGKQEANASLWHQCFSLSLPFPASPKKKKKGGGVGNVLR